MSQSIINDPAIINSTVHTILAENPTQVAAYFSGQSYQLNFFFLEVMRATRNLANPSLVTDALKRRLDQLRLEAPPMPTTKPPL